MTVEHHLGDLAERIEAMQAMPGIAMPPAPSAVAAGLMDFSVGAGREPGSATSQALTKLVHEGGDEGRNRWSTFSQVAGHHIHCARRGEYDLNEAARLTHGWVLANMIPPWPWERFETEFRALVNLDVRDRGAMPAVQPPVQLPPAPSVPRQRGFLEWDVSQTLAPPGPRRFLVPGLVQAGVSHTLAADSGGGKTFMLLDLGLKLAAAGAGMEGLSWLGVPVNMKETAGGTVVVFTAEDDREEVHIRLDEIDQGGALRTAAAGRYRVVPLVDDGGAFPLVSHAQGGDPEPSRPWLGMQARLQEIVEDGGRVMMVMIDTLAATLHGEENRSNVITEYYTQLAVAASRLQRAATVVSHHIRKGNKAQPIKDKEDMKAAVRGSSAIMGSSRVVWGLWHAHNYWSLLSTIGEEARPDVCYKFAVIKANNPAMDNSTRTLMRQKTGLLVDVTAKVGKLDESNKLAKLAWLAHAIGVAAEARRPFTKTGVNGLFERRSELPEELRRTPQKLFTVLTDQLANEKRIIRGKLANGGDGYLDVPGGPMNRKGGGLYRDPGSLDVDWSRWYYRSTTGEIIGK